MEESIKENIIKVIAVLIILVLLMCTISTNVKYDKLESKIDGYKYEISELEKTKKEYETLIEAYKKSQLEDKATIETQKEEITNLENQINSLNSKINKLNVEIVTITKERDTANKTITDLNNKIKNLNNTVDTLNNTINDNKSLIENLNTKLTAETNKVTELTTTNSTLNDNITKLNKKLETINTYHAVNSEVELIQALKSGGNVILKTDILMSTDLVIEDVYTSIDLNGYNLVVTSIELKDSSLEIKDSKSLAQISIVGDNEDLVKGIKVDENSTLKITNGKYEGKNLFQIAGTLYVVNGNFNNKQEEIIKKEESATVEVYDGTFII